MRRRVTPDMDGAGGTELKHMKAIKLLSVLMFAVAMMAGPTWAAEDKKPCCDPKADSLKCECPCCKKAAEKGKVCKKCHPAKKAEDKK
jgi:hypothetical protein